MSRRLNSLAWLVVGWSLAVGCATKSPDTRSLDKLLRETTGARNAAVSSNQTGFDIGERLEAGNAAWSPYSITTALGMLHAGARGATADELAEALHVGAADGHDRRGRLHSVFTSMESDGENGPVLQVANDIWIRDGFELETSYLERLQVTYGATPRRFDLSAGREEAAGRINRRVADQTSGRIEELIPPRQFPEDVVTVLVNAIYLQAKWRHPFPEEATGPRPFHRLDDQSDVEVATMRQTEEFAYTAFRDFQAVVLPYKRRLSAAVVVPDRGRFRDVAARFDAAQLEAVLDEATTHEVSLQLPKFRVGTTTSLKSALRQMGVRRMFDPERANLDGISEKRQLVVDDIYHGTFVDVAERGTEAAASTGIVAELVSGSLEIEKVDLRVDRPFLFFVFEQETRAVLFSARVVDPS